MLALLIVRLLLVCTLGSDFGRDWGGRGIDGGWKRVEEGLRLVRLMFEEMGRLRE